MVEIGLGQNQNIMDSNRMVLNPSLDTHLIEFEVNSKYYQ